jgi:cell wall-associated NlpC family hydrolase
MKTFKIKMYVFFLVFLLSMTASGCGADLKSVTASENATSQQGTAGKSFKQAVVDGIVLDDKAAVVKDTVVDIFLEPDVTSERVTQAIYNQPLRIIEEKDGWTKVSVVDGSKGWLRSKFIDINKASILENDFTHKLVVTSKDKVISSLPNGGATLKNVVMGTEFYSFNETGDAYEVYLPGNKTGWLKGSGLINLKVDEEIPLTRVEDFVSTALKFKGTSYLIRGMSTQGIDSAGLVYISARVNGVDIPRTMEGQLFCGSQIGIDEAGEGDLVFIAPKGNRKSISSVGICTGGGSYIFADKNTGYVTIKAMNEESSDGIPTTARRIFKR